MTCSWCYCAGFISAKSHGVITWLFIFFFQFIFCKRITLWRSNGSHMPFGWLPSHNSGFICSEPAFHHSACTVQLLPHLCSAFSVFSDGSGMPRASWHRPRGRAHLLYSFCAYLTIWSLHLFLAYQDISAGQTGLMSSLPYALEGLARDYYILHISVSLALKS